MSYFESDRYNSGMRMVVVVSNLLSIVGFGLIGVIIAYLKRADARGTLWETHITYIIRTFWMGVLGIIIGSATAFIGIGVLILIVVGLWWLIRSIKSLLKAINDEPIRNPETLLF
ncbi:hypothetical protein [Niveispirillum sp.]|uniref:DUF4870 family protein n=1 Tax=Niveispirillum sp. TaxID=1917217 RepID=UPI001B3ED155|nr:hypothetical protein [Niveispirillum sp.]MBP7337125.1 hypothetical protein [Niveispirillum sp.]